MKTLRQRYPFSAIVGQEELKQALLLNLIYPGIGGVLIRGEKGTAKSTAVRALEAILPEIDVVDGCPCGCDPHGDALCPWCLGQEALESVSLQVRVVDLPVGSTEDRVVGSLDMETALREGRRRFEPGILADANRGILYVDEINLLDDHLQEEDDGKNKAQKPNAVVLEDESMALAKDYIELNYGKSYLTPKEQRQLNYQICTGAHKECKLHFSDGLLSRPDASAEGTSPAEEQPPLQDSADTYQMEYARRVLTENLEILKANQLMTRQNILSLADILKRALLTREEKEIFPDEYGKIRVDRLWNIGRTDNRKMFDREFIQEFTDFAVEILIDSSGSQQIRQSMVALQGYIISEALSLAEIPHRVMGFCTFGDYTVMRRYRDYDEPIEADKRILEFYGSANNRDGLAIRAAAHSLSARREENKILIVLSDGTPNDIIVSKSKSRLRVQYCNDYAVKDTAREVYSLRSKGIAVMGIFAGEEEALPAEKQIFGNEFAYIRKISDFSNVVGRYLKEQLMV